MKLFLSMSIFRLVFLQYTSKTEKIEYSNLTSAILKTVCLQYVIYENDIIRTHFLSDSTLRLKDRGHIQILRKNKRLSNE